MKRKTISVFLEKHDDGDQIHIFYCPSCRNPILQYQGETVLILPGLSPTKLPLLVKCKNKNCERVYNFEAFVEEELMKRG